MENDRLFPQAIKALLDLYQVSTSNYYDAGLEDAAIKNAEAVLEQVDWDADKI